jgi:hypothetical protein
MRKPKFDFYEYVKIIRGAFRGETGIVLGRSNDSRFGYAVLVGEDCIYFKEGSLRATGRKGKRSDVYSGKSIKVNENGDIIG